MMKESKKHRKKQFVVARIFDKHGRLLSEGYNSYIRTDPMFARMAKKVNRPQKEYVHAEAAAVFKLKYNDRRRAYAMYVYRFSENGNPANAKPCPVCQEIIKLTKIKKVFYTTENTKLDMGFPEYIEMRNNAKFWDR